MRRRSLWQAESKSVDRSAPMRRAARSSQVLRRRLERSRQSPRIGNRPPGFHKPDSLLRRLLQASSHRDCTSLRSSALCRRLRQPLAATSRRRAPVHLPDPRIRPAPSSWRAILCHRSRRRLRLCAAATNESADASRWPRHCGTATNQTSHVCLGYDRRKDR